MEALVGKWLARSIGISNFWGVLIMDLLRYAKIPPATLQIEHHPYLTQTGIVKHARENGIAVTAVLFDTSPRKSRRHRPPLPPLQ